MEADGEFSSTADHVDSCGAQSMADEEIPDEFLDPIQFTLMKDPVILSSVDCPVIVRHFLTEKTDPFIRSHLTEDMLIPDVELKAEQPVQTETRAIRSEGLKIQEPVPQTESKHRDKRMKPCPRPCLEYEVLYDKNKWIDWALTPHHLEDLIDMRNEQDDIFYIHVAGVCKEGVAEFGYIIRDCHGTPISAYSESVPNETEPLSKEQQKRKAFYQEMKAVDKSLEHADKLGLKFVLMVSKKCDVATAVLDCYDGEIYSVHDEEIVSVSVEIRRKLLQRRCSYPEEYNIFNIRAGEVNPVLYVVSLAASEENSKLDLKFDEGRKKMPLDDDKLAELMGRLYTEASSYSCFHP